MDQEFEDTLTIELETAVSNLNGSESWQSIPLREPIFAEVSDFYKESRKTNEADAMATLISVVSGVDLMAVKKLPIRKYREAQAYLLGFLNYFPTLENGKTE